MRKYILLSVLLLTAISCQQFKEVGGVEKIAQITTNVAVTSNTVDPNVPRPDKYTVKFINYDDNYEVRKTTDASGKVSADDIIPGKYTVTVSGEIAEKGFTYYYSGSLTNINIIEGGQTLNIDVVASKAGSLILKEIYFNGALGYYFKDQFYEIYNNGDEVQYVDKLCIGNILPASPSTTSYTWEVPDGHPENYIYFGAIWQIPGDGNDYPVQPGESIIIAQGAQNHKLLKPTSPVDLSGAEFETFIVNQTVNPDNPNSINMDLRIGFTVFGTQWLVTVFGGAYAIFIPEGDIDNTTWVQPQGLSTKAKEIPIDLVIDAVEIVNNSTKINQKRMPTSLDAGATYTGGAYNSKSVSRRVKEVREDGRIIYWDTNNSTEDFKVNDVAVVRRDGVGIPSWNTWAK
ncbi:MAG: DUF4876 domain-containing protein [Bacteroidales bacterium]|nr:DUF4876 domain-containing protein [Bacteroidales bacterium]MDD4670035.1 DUF4876 domain-containing protein [Bacteroidales bacterium]